MPPLFTFSQRSLNLLQGKYWRWTAAGRLAKANTANSQTFKIKKIFSMNACAIGIDLGGTNIKGVAVTEEGNTLLQTNLGFAPGEKMIWADKIRGLVREIQTQAGPARLARAHASTSPTIGVSAPGLAAPD